MTVFKSRLETGFRCYIIWQNLVEKPLNQHTILGKYFLKMVLFHEACKLQNLYNTYMKKYFLIDNIAENCWMKRFWILQLKQQDCATAILFWRRFKKRCSNWVSGCLQRREKEVVDSFTSYVKRSWKYVYWIINIKSLDFENNTLIDRNSFCRKGVFNLKRNVLLKLQATLLSMTQS